MNNISEPVYAGDYAKVPPGEYKARFLKTEQKEFYGKKKLYIWFELKGGLEDGTELFMSCNIGEAIHRTSKYLKIWVTANYGKKPEKGECMGTEVFERKLFKVRVKTVSKNHRKEPLPEEDIYSVVEEILEVLEPSGPNKPGRTIKYDDFFE